MRGTTYQADLLNVVFVQKRLIHFIITCPLPSTIHFLTHFNIHDMVFWALFYIWFLFDTVLWALCNWWPMCNFLKYILTQYSVNVRIFMGCSDWSIYTRIFMLCSDLSFVVIYVGWDRLVFDIFYQSLDSLVWLLISNINVPICYGEQWFLRPRNKLHGVLCQRPFWQN